MRGEGERARVLFLCTGNSCRSQMAEGLLRARFGDRFTALSAGTVPNGVNRLAVAAMREIGIDISSHSSKSVDSLAGSPVDLAVTLCDSALGACPVLPGAKKVVHRAFEDPPALAAVAATDEEALPHYRRVRDEIAAFIEVIPTLVPV
jgi:arsenate reductase (thioredoxin)